MWAPLTKPVKNLAQGLIDRKQFLILFCYYLELMFVADYFSCCNFMCPMSSSHIEICISIVSTLLYFLTCNKRICASWRMDTCRVTKEHMTTRHGYIMYNNCACNSISIGYHNILTCMRAKPCGHFGFEDLMWLKSAKVYLKITYSCFNLF